MVPKYVLQLLLSEKSQNRTAEAREKLSTDWECLEY